MMTLIRELRVAMDSEIDRLTQSTAIGSASDWPDYRYRVGVVTGWKRARSRVDEVFKQWLNDEDEVEPEIEHETEHEEKSV